MATESGPAEALRGEILEEARKEAGRIVLRSRQEAEGILDAAAAGASRVREEELDRARKEALRRRESILSTVPVEAGRLRVGRIESLLDAVLDEARTRLHARSGFDYREAVVGLAAMAIGQMAGESFVARVPEADRILLGNGFREDVARRADRAPLSLTLSFDADMGQGGVIVEDAAAFQVCDNGLLTRLERMWPELRRQIAEQAFFASRKESGGGRQ